MVKLSPHDGFVTQIARWNSFYEAKVTGKSMSNWVPTEYKTQS